MKNHHFCGKSHYKWQFPLAMFVCQRVVTMVYTPTNITGGHHLEPIVDDYPLVISCRACRIFPMVRADWADDFSHGFIVGKLYPTYPRRTHGLPSYMCFSMLSIMFFPRVKNTFPNVPSMSFIFQNIPMIFYLHCLAVSVGCKVRPLFTIAELRNIIWSTSGFMWNIL